MFKKFTTLRQRAHRPLALALIAAAIGATGIKPAAAQDYTSFRSRWEATKWYAAIDPSYKLPLMGSQISMYGWWQLLRAPSECSKSPQLSYVNYNKTIGNYIYTGMRFVPLSGPSPYQGKKAYQRIFKYDAVFFDVKYDYGFYQERPEWLFYIGKAEKHCGVAYF